MSGQQGGVRTSADEAMDEQSDEHARTMRAIAIKIVHEEQRLANPASRRHEDIHRMGKIEGMRYALAMMLALNKDYAINVANCADFREADYAIADARRDDRYDPTDWHPDEIVGLVPDGAGVETPLDGSYRRPNPGPNGPIHPSCY